MYLELFRISRAAADCEGVGDMVSKRGVVGMLLDCHQLDGIVSQGCYTGQHIIYTRPRTTLNHSPAIVSYAGLSRT